MPQQGDEPQGYASPQAYLESTSSEKSRHRPSTHSEVIFTKVPRRLRRRGPCLVAPNQAKPQRKEGQDKHRTRAVVTCRGGGVTARGGAARAFSRRGNLLLPELRIVPAYFITYRTFTQIRHFIIKRRDVAKEYRTSSWHRPGTHQWWRLGRLEHFLESGVAPSGLHAPVV